MDIRIGAVCEDYNGCGGCVHNDDPSCMCMIRGCIHAFSELKDRYQPKEYTTITRLDLTTLKEFNELISDLIEIKEKGKNG